MRSPPSCLPLMRKVASPKGLTEGEIGRACCEAGCSEHTDCKFSPSVACGDSSLVRGSQALAAGACKAGRQNRRKLTKRGALCYDGDRRCQKRQAVSTSRKGGDAHGYIRRADPDRYFDREHLQSGLSDLQKEMTAPGQGVRSNSLIQT